MLYICNERPTQLITHLIKPGTVFFFNKSKPSCDLQAGVLMVVTERSPSGIWCFRHLAREVEHTAVIDDVRTRILFSYDDPNSETFIGQLPFGELHVTEWKPEYLLSRRTQPSFAIRAVGLLKRLW